MINSLQKGDDVYYLSDYEFRKGTVASINEKTITIADGGLNGFQRPVTRRVIKEKCAHPDEKIFVVWETWNGVNGRGAHRIERDSHPEARVEAKKYSQLPHHYPSQETKDGPLIFRD